MEFPLTYTASIFNPLSTTCYFTLAGLSGTQPALNGARRRKSPLMPTTIICRQSRTLTINIVHSRISC